MSQMEKTLFNMKFTAKAMEREAKKTEKKEKELHKKILEAKKKGNDEGARIYAADAIRNKHQTLSYLKLASRIEAVAGRVETAIRMRQFTKSIGMVVSGMDAVLSTMDPEKIGSLMDKFEHQFESLDVTNAHLDKAIASTTATSVPEGEVDDLIRQVEAQATMDRADQFQIASVTGLMGAGPTRAQQSTGRIAETVAAAPAPGAGGPAAPPAGGAGAAPGAGAGSGGGFDGGAGGGGDIAASLAARLAALRK